MDAFDLSGEPIEQERNVVIKVPGRYAFFWSILTAVVIGMAIGAFLTVELLGVWVPQ
jgi:hypothetical protein